MNKQVRPAAVAGQFYPADPFELRRMVQTFLAEAHSTRRAPKALIAPHAGYVFSGPIAASAYKTVLDTPAAAYRTVILLGPTHRIHFDGLAATDLTHYETPLGEIAINQKKLARALEFPHVSIINQAHSQEHSLEVHLPFLQESLKEFDILPLVVGEATGEQVAEVLEAFWADHENLFVISSDLSHYLDYPTARRMDQSTTQAIVELNPNEIGFHNACGRIPVQGLLQLAKKHGLKAETLDVRNSGDTAGPKNKVVGYGAYFFH